MIVLDTNVISEFMTPKPSDTVVAWLDRQDVRTLYLTAVGLAELRFGIARLEAGRRKADLQARLDLMVARIFEGRILPFTETAAGVLAERMAVARRNGRAVGFQDGMIAASIAAVGFVVATRDGAPFEAMGVDVIDPWQFDKDHILP
jgi:predicted nucleic acid-binding protein